MPPYNSQHGSRYDSQYDRRSREGSPSRQGGDRLSNKESRDRLRKRHVINARPESPRSSRGDKEGRERVSGLLSPRSSQGRGQSGRRLQEGTAATKRSSQSDRLAQSNRLSQPSEPELRLRAPKRPRPQTHLSPDARRKVAERELAAGRPGNNAARGLEAKSRTPQRRDVEGRRSPSLRAISHRETDPLASSSAARRSGRSQRLGSSQKKKPSRKASDRRAIDRLSKEQREAERKYLERKAKHRLHAAKLTIILSMAAVAFFLLVWIVVAFINSELFYPSDIEVQNAHFLSADDVVNIAAIDMESSTITMNTDELESRLIAHPWIMRANVSTRFPRQVVIEVFERTPAVEIEIDGERAANWVASSDGMWLGYLHERSPRIVDPTGSVADVNVGAINVIPVAGAVELDPEWGERIDDESLLNVLAHLRGLDSRIVARVSRVSAPEVGRTSLFTIDEVELDVGRADNLAEKSTIILRILEEEAGNVVLINVRSIHNPTWRGHSR